MGMIRKCVSKMRNAQKCMARDRVEEAVWEAADVWRLF